MSEHVTPIEAFKVNERENKALLRRMIEVMRPCLPFQSKESKSLKKHGTIVLNFGHTNNISSVTFRPVLAEEARVYDHPHWLSLPFVEYNYHPGFEEERLLTSRLGLTRFIVRDTTETFFIVYNCYLFARSGHAVKVEDIHRPVEQDDLYEQYLTRTDSVSVVQQEVAEQTSFALLTHGDYEVVGGTLHQVEIGEYRYKRY